MVSRIYTMNDGVSLGKQERWIKGEDVVQEEVCLSFTASVFDARQWARRTILDGVKVETRK